jgi:hypothetical protein
MMAVFSVVFAAIFLAAIAVIVKIFVDDWRDLQGRGQVAELPDPDPFDQDAVPLTEAEQDEAICQAWEWQFSTSRPRRIR